MRIINVIRELSISGVDIKAAIVYRSYQIIIKGRRRNASILCEMPFQKRNERPKEYNYEKW